MGQPHLTSALGLSFALLVASCAGGDSDTDPSTDAMSNGETASSEPESAEPDSAEPESAAADDGSDSMPFAVEEQATYDSPWALEFLPGTEKLLITLQTGELILHDLNGEADVSVEGLPEDIVVDGQGGLGDVIAAPDFEESGRIYLSWVTSGEGGTGAVAGHAELVDSGSSAELQDLTVIWEQQPQASGSGHFSHRLAFSADGEHLFVTSGDRQLLDPAQDLDSGLGKIMRLTPEGDAAPGNPFADDGGVTAQIWSSGHRNALGIDIDAEGRLWSSEMGPAGGDELNLIEEGQNYGWPEASNGEHYDGAEIPDHAEDDGFAAPLAWWDPAISPGSLMIYEGDLFADWTGDAFLGALSGQALVRVELDGDTAGEDEIWDMGARIRDVAEAPDGSVWVIEDGDGAGLLRLTPTE